MNYIVLDLEWNQPTSYQSSAYRKIGDSLLFEVLQFGAAKVNEDLQVLDTLSIPVHPTFYLTIHPRVKRMTGITYDLVREAEPFPEALKAFLDWCGEDCVFVTWGRDDVSVLKQNMDCFQVPQALPKMYDLQALYAKEKGKSGQTALKTAMEELQIPEEENRPFHDARNDAYYTALVFAAVKEPKNVLNHETQARKYAHNERKTRMKVTDMVSSVAKALEDLKSPQCPVCGKVMRLTTEIIPQAPGKYVALCKCPTHGALFLKARFMALPDGKKGMNLSITTLNQQTKAYVHTKELQYRIKRARGDYDGVDVEDLSGVSSSMPFEEN